MPEEALLAPDVIVLGSLLKEREKQTQLKGYSPARDDGYVHGDLAAAASAYAWRAGSPGTRTNLWPWGQSQFKPSGDRRKDLVKALALLWAEVERIDRLQLEPVEVARDALGWWSHPGYLAEYGDDEISGEECASWFARHRLESAQTLMSDEVKPEVAEAYFNDGQCNCSAWAIKPPPGAGWFLLSIYDSEDGPVCDWGRPLVTPAPDLPTA